MKINFSILERIRKSKVRKGKGYVSLYALALDSACLLIVSLFQSLFWAPVQMKVFAVAIVPD